MILAFVTYPSKFLTVTSRWCCCICIRKRLCTCRWTFSNLRNLLQETICNILTTSHLTIFYVTVALMSQMCCILMLVVLISDTISTGVRRSLSLNSIICNISSTTSSTLPSMCLIHLYLILRKFDRTRSSIFSSIIVFRLVTQIVIFELLFICRCFLLIIHVLFILCFALIYHI